MKFDINVHHHKSPEPSVDCAEVRIMLRLERIEKKIDTIIKGDGVELAALRDKLKAATSPLDEAVKANS